LIETLSALVEVYDAEHHRMPDVSGIEVLRFLIEQHDLNQADRRKSALKVSYPKC